MNRKAGLLLAIVRILLGWTFLWAFIDKLFGLGFATEPTNAWIAGGSPTFDFLMYGASGPLAPFYQSIAGHPIVDGLFMFGLFGLGTSLLLGIALNIAAIGGPLMMLLLWSASLPLENNPLIDEHIIYAVLIPALAAAKAGVTFGLGSWWSSLVRDRIPVLE